MEIYELGGNPKYLEAAKRSADQLIDMLRANNVRICDTGTFEGMPSMSILKPMLVLYRSTGDKKFLDFSREIISYLDRDDGSRPISYAIRFPASRCTNGIRSPKNGRRLTVHGGRSRILPHNRR